MRLKLFPYVAFSFLAFALCAPSRAQPVHDDNPSCRSPGAFNRHLKTHNEEIVWSGSSDGKRYEVYASIDASTAEGATRENATWTANYTSPDGKKCLVATGVEWKDSFSPGWRVRNVTVAQGGGKSAGRDPQISRDGGESDYAIGNTRLKLVGSCDNGYSLDRVVGGNPFVVGEGTVQVASDRVNQYNLSVHHADHLFILSSAPSGTAAGRASWAMLFPLPVPNEDFTVWGCTYIEAVGAHGLRLSHRHPRRVRKRVSL